MAPISKFFSKALPTKNYNCFQRSFATSTSKMKQSCKFLVAGGGTGGITMAARILGIGEKDVVVIEPSETHYYQPYWTLVGGMKTKFENSHRPTSDVIPKGAKWIKDKIVGFDPASNLVHTEKTGQIEYSYLVVALGLQLDFEQIKGLPEAFETKGVCSIYSQNTVLKTCKAMDDFVEGNAIFTQPINPIKCGGAPQKIMYLAEEYFSKTNKRNKANIIFNTALGKMFSCQKYETVLKKVAKSKNISVNYFHKLTEVKPESKEAIFEKLDGKGTTIGTETCQYEMLHVVPPMIAPAVIRESVFAEPAGFMDVNQNTLQSKKFENVFGLGDCTNLPTSKTAAAVASQSGILTENLKQAMKGSTLTNRYYGYTSCPFVTGYNKGILAEFNYELQPEETLPINQGKERYISYYIKKDAIPFIYWNFMLKGKWAGPGLLRKILHFGLTK